MDTIEDKEKQATFCKTRDDKPLIYASLFNLIIYTIDEAKKDYLNEIVQTILKKYPCRMTFIHGCSDTDKDYIHTTVTTAVVSDNENTIACDQITIEVSQKQFHRIPFLILPHIVPDLPLYLLWGQDPTVEHDILPSIERYASRVIFDSDSAQNLQDFSKKMIQMMDLEKLEICDINWTALTNWRETIARIFNTEEKIRQLRLTKTIDIQFNSTQSQEVLHPDIQAIYLQGWIAAQMEWQFKSIVPYEAGKQITYANGEQLVTITLSPSERGAQDSGGIYRVELVDNEGDSIIVDRTANPSKAIIHVTTHDQCEMPFNLPLSDQRKGIAFVQELFYQKTSSHYRNMLSTIASY